MAVFSSPAFDGHEAVHLFEDRASGLKAIVAVHSTVRGPSAGGVRMLPYADEQAALDDALKLSRAMTYKNAMAGLDLGGGKAVIIGDSRTGKSEALFEALGRAVEAVGGAYWSACDVGTAPADAAVARRTSRYAAGLVDSGPNTAEGVFRGLVLAAERAFGRGVAGMTVAIQGVGDVGRGLAERLHRAGARLVVADTNAEAAAAVADAFGAEVVAPDAILDAPADVFSPCALGGVITAEALDRMSARVIAGGANNQLASPEAGRAVFERGLVYAPDYVINGGGIIAIASEIRGYQTGGAYDPDWVEAKTARLAETLAEVLDRSRAEGRPAEEVAADIARSRLAPAADSPRPVG